MFDASSEISVWGNANTDITGREALIYLQQNKL